MQERSGNRIPPGKGWQPAGSHHCVVVRDGGTKRMGRVQQPCDYVPKSFLNVGAFAVVQTGEHRNAASAWRGGPTGSEIRANGRKGSLGTCEIRLSPFEKSQKAGETGQRTPWRIGSDSCPVRAKKRGRGGYRHAKAMSLAGWRGEAFARSGDSSSASDYQQGRMCGDWAWTFRRYVEFGDCRAACEECGVGHGGLGVPCFMGSALPNAIPLAGNKVASLKGACACLPPDRELKIWDDSFCDVDRDCKTVVLVGPWNHWPVIGGACLHP